MRISRRRLFGLVALGVSIVTGLALAWCGVGEGPVIESHTYSSGSVTATASSSAMHWPPWISFSLLGLAILGVLLLVMPTRKTNA